MGKIVIVMGNSGVGKTTLTRLLCEQGGYASGFEQIGERPFQSLFAQDLQRYALSNQFDFLLFRTEQELLIRYSEEDGILDGGMEMDFDIFTRHFFNKGFLSEPEFQLCERLVSKIRRLLPPPDLVIHLSAPLEKISERYARRGRALEIARQTDLGELQTLLDDWLKQWPGKVIHVDASLDDPTYSEVLPGLLKQMEIELNSPNAPGNISPSGITQINT
jgi:deoxyadenosine/deoxycytidine kinase